MDPSVAKQILQKYQLAYRRILPPHKGYRNESFPIVLNDGSKINLMFYKSEPAILQRITRTNIVSDFLHDKGLPTRKLLNPRLMKLQAGATQKHIALYSYLPGSTIPWETYTKNHIKLLGLAMNVIHTQLLDLPQGSRQLFVTEADVVDEYRRIVTNMQHYFAKSDVQAALKNKLGITIEAKVFRHFDEILTQADVMPEKQVLHMDFVRGNTLFGEPSENGIRFKNLTLTGILDFEKAAYGHRVFDAARTLAFLLVDCKYKQPDKVEKYFIHSGYIKRGKVSFSQPELDVLNSLVNMFLFYDFYKFLRHNPYEYLDQNEHFVRTRGMLENRKMIV